ncbi:MAG: hypothetical protein J7J92_01445 [Candidatus Aenigmarchaeota archaeon]|nr:hypothetical protein [Candidatus Aenigmarchaeota archaeon]
MNNTFENKTDSTKFAVLFAVFMLTLISVSSAVFAQATNVVVRGDLPDTNVSYTIEIYDASQTGPCDGSADTGTNLLALTSGVGNTNYDDDVDYSLTFSLTASPSQTVYVYYCLGTATGVLRTWYSKSVTEGQTYVIDLARVKGTNLHSDLNSDNVFVCHGSTRLDTELRGIGGSNIEYDQWYPIDESIVSNNIYVYLDNDQTNVCQFDATKSTGRIINVTSANGYNNFAVYPTFAPDTKAQGDLHDDFDGTILYVWDSDGNNIGMSYVTDGDCYDDSDDDYTLYYDNPSSGIITMALHSTAATNPTLIEGLSLGFSSQDAVVKVYGTVPTDIDEVSISDGTLTYKTTPDGSGNYALYVKDNFVGTIKFWKSGSEVFTKSLSIPDTSSTTCSSHDIQLDLAKYYGTAHDDLKTGYKIEVYSDSSFTTKISDPSYPGDPDDSTGEYEVYFDATGGLANSYVKIDGPTYDTMVYGSSASAGDEILYSPEDKLYGTVHTDITLIQTDIDQDAGFWDDFKDAKTTPDGSGNYRMYSDLSGNTDIEFRDSTQTVLTRTKMFASNIQLDVAKLSGNIDENFNTGGTSPVWIYDSYPGTPLNSLYFVTDNSGANDDSYYAYFECTPTTDGGVLSDGNVDVYFKDDSGSSEYTLRMDVDNNPSDGDKADTISGGDDITLDMIYTLTGTLPISVNYIILSEQTNGDYVKLVITGTWPHTYKMYFDSITGSNWYLDVYDELYTAGTPNLVLSRTRTGWTGNSNTLNSATFNVAKLVGDAHSNLENSGDGSDNIEVYADSLCTNKLSSEDRQPNDDGYIGGTNDYMQYFETTTPSYEQYYINTIMNNGDTFSTCGNPFSTNAGGTAVQNLVADKTGVVTSDIANVAVDWDGSLPDDNDAYTQVVSTGSEYKYHLFTIVDNNVDVNYYDSTPSLLLTLDDSFPSEATYTNDISKVTGTIPTDIDSVELEYGTAPSTYADGACGGLYYTQTTSSSGSYTLYFEDDSRTYDILFCKSGNVVLKWSFTDQAGGQTFTIDVAKLSGTVNDNFNNAGFDVYTDRIGGTLLSSTSFYTDSGDTGLDSYEVYFIESDDSLATPIDVDNIDLKMTDSASLVSWRLDVDTNNANNAIDAIAGGDMITLNLDNRLTGTTHNDIKTITLHDATPWTIALAETDGSIPSVYAMYFDSVSALNGNWWYDAHTNPVVLTRDQEQTNTGSLDGDVFNVGKLSGDTHSDLYGGTIEVWDTIDCGSNKLSSETVNPTGTSTPDYTQYFEADQTNPTSTTYYIKATTSDSLASRGNGFTIGANYAQTKDLVVEKTGKATTDITKVAADLDQNGAIDGSDAYTADFDTDHVYKLFTITDGSVDVQYYVSGSLEFTLYGEDWSTAGTYTNNIDSLSGDVDEHLNNGWVELWTISGQGCSVSWSAAETEVASNSNLHDIDLIQTGGSPDYTVYMKADDSTYYAVFCDSNGKKVFEWPVASSATGGNAWEMDVGEVIGEAHSNLEGGSDTIEIYDSDGTPYNCGSTKLSSETVHPSDNGFYSNADYAQFFLQYLHDNSGTHDYMPGGFCKKITDADISNNYIIYHVFDDSTKGGTITEDLDVLKDGIVTEEAQNTGLTNVLVSAREGSSSGDATMWTNTISGGSYRLYLASGTYDFLYEKTGWVDYPINDESISSDTTNDITMLYTIKVKASDELNNPKEGYELKVTNGGVQTCTEGTTVGSPIETGYCDADNSNDEYMYWAYSPGDAYGFGNSASVAVDMREYLDGYVYQYDSDTITDQAQYYHEYYNPFTIRVVDIYNELGTKLDIADSTGGLVIGETDVDVSDPTRIADPTGRNYAAGTSSHYGDPRGDGDTDLFLPIKGTSSITLTAHGPGYVDEDIEVTPDPNVQKTVMWGDYDRHCVKNENNVAGGFSLDPSQGGYTTYATYCDDDTPQRLNGDGLLYTLKLDIWDEKTTEYNHRIYDARIVLNPDIPIDPSDPNPPVCYAPYKTGDGLPDYYYDDDPDPDDEFPHVDYVWDPITQKYYIPAIGNNCDYYLEIKKDGYVTRGTSKHGISTRPDEALDDIELSSNYQTALNFSRNVTCDTFAPTGPVDGVVSQQCSGMPYSLRVNAYDQFDHPIEGFTVVVEDSGHTLPPSDSDQYFCWIPVELVSDGPTLVGTGPQTYQECVENGGTVMPVSLLGCTSYSFDKQLKYEYGVYDFAFCPGTGLGDPKYYARWNTIGVYKPGVGYTPIAVSDGDYCTGSGFSYTFKPGYYIDILPDKCTPTEGDMAMRLFISPMDYGLSGLGYTNTFIITDGENGWNSTVNRSIEQWWLPDFSWEDGPNGVVLYPLNALSGPVDNPVHIHISKPGYEADTKDGIVIDSLYQVVIDAILVDTIPPEVHVVSPEEGDWLTGTVQLTADTWDASGVANVTFRIDGTYIGTDNDHSDEKWNISLDTTTVLDGSHDITAYACDINNYCQESDIVTVGIDNTAPSQISIYASQSSNCNAGYDCDGDISVTWPAATDTGIGVDYYEAEVSMDSTFTTGVLSSGPITSLFASFNNIPTDGTWFARVRAVDKLGNVGPWSAVKSITVDRTIPVVSITTPTTTFVSGSIAITFTYADNAIDTSTADLLIDGISVSPTGCGATSCTYTWNTASYQDGEHTIIAKINDVAGNLGESEVKVVSVDNTGAESIAITYPYHDQYLTGTTTIQAVTADRLSGVASVGFEYYDGSWHTISTDSSAPWTASFDACSHTGATKLKATATDGEGNSLTSTEVPIIVDCTAPSFTVNVPTSPVSGTIEITATTSDNDVVATDFEYSTSNSGPWYKINVDASKTPVGSQWQYQVHWDTTEVADGTYYIRVSMVDYAGHVTIDPLRTIDIDNTPPAISITTPSNNQFVKGIVEITFTMSDSHIDYSTAEVSTDGGQTWTNPSCTGPSCTFNWDTTLATDGLAYGLQAKASDSVGNVGYSEMTTVVVDNRAMASMAIVKPIDQGIATGTVTIEAIASDAVSGTQYVEFYVDGTMIHNDTSYYNSWTAPWNTGSYADGAHTLKVRGCDAIGNCRDSTTIQIVSDNNPPSPPILDVSDLDGDGYDNDGVLTLTWFASDDGTGSGIDYYKGEVSMDQTFTTGVLGSKTSSLSYSISEVPDGTWYGRVRACDQVGLCSGWSNIENIIVDTMEPTTVTASASIDNSPYDTDGSYQISWTPATDTNGILRYDIMENGVITSVGLTTSKSYTGKPDGTYYYRIRAVDSAGNEGEWSNLLTVIVDTTPPSVPALISPEVNYYTNDQTPTFVWGSATDEISGVSQYEIMIDTASYQAGTTSFAPTNNLGEGTYTWKVRAQDNAGNWGSWSGSRSLTVDTTPPVLSGATPSGAQNSRSFATFVHTDEWTSCRFSTNDVTYDNMDHLMSTSDGLDHYGQKTVEQDGSYTIYFGCKDKAGNINYIHTSTFSIDSIAPTIETTGPSGYQTSTPSEFTVKTDVDATCRWDTNDKIFANMPQANEFTTTAGTPKTISLPAGTVIEGANAIFVRCKDVNGNVMDSSSVIVFTVDTTKPLIIDISPSDEYISSGTVNLNVITTEATNCKYSTSLSGTYTDFTDGQGTAAHYAQLTGLSEGFHEYYIKCTDLAGNIADSPEQSLTGYGKTNFTIDTTSPSVSGCSLTKNLISYYPLNSVNPTADISCTITEANIKNVKAYVKDVNGNTLADFDLTGTGSGTISANKIGVDGTYSVVVEAEDEAGHKTTSAPMSLAVDGTPPETIVALDDTTVNGGGATTTVKAVVKDISSNITDAEIYIGPGNTRQNIGENCTPLTSMYNADGSFNNGTGSVYKLLPFDSSFDNDKNLEEVMTTVSGNYAGRCIFVHAKDTTGNWEQTKAIYMTKEGKAVSASVTEPVAAAPGFWSPTGMPFISQHSALIAILALVGLGALVSFAKLSKGKILKLHF